MGKSQFPNVFNWQTTSPVTTFLPSPGPGQDVAGNSKPLSGNISGSFSGSQTIYSNIIGIRQMDSVGLEVTWAGTPTGVLTVMCSNSGINFYALTFNPTLTQPSGTSLGYLIALQQVPFQYIYLQYSNTSGVGTITAYGQNKAFNS